MVPGSCSGREGGLFALLFVNCVSSLSVGIGCAGDGCMKIVCAGETIRQYYSINSTTVSGINVLVVVLPFLCYVLCIRVWLWSCVEEASGERVFFCLVCMQEITRGKARVAVVFSSMDGRNY